MTAGNYASALIAGLTLACGLTVAVAGVVVMQRLAALLGAL